MVSSVCFHKMIIPSRELTYPTWGKGTSSSNIPWVGICDHWQEGSEKRLMLWSPLFPETEIALVSSLGNWVTLIIFYFLNQPPLQPNWILIQECSICFFHMSRTWICTNCTRNSMIISIPSLTSVGSCSSLIRPSMSNRSPMPTYISNQAWCWGTWDHWPVIVDHLQHPDMTITSVSFPNISQKEHL